MGDRTYVEIIIHKHYYDLLLNGTFSGDAYKLGDAFNADDIEFEDDLVKFQCYEVNYATWDTLENLLSERKIEYDKMWAAGGDYEAGESWTRVINGEYVEHELTDTGLAIKEHNDTLLANLDNPEKIKELILKLDKVVNPFKVEPLGLPQSIDFIKNA